jgi:hypothetical protein
MNPVAALGGYVLSREDLDSDPALVDDNEEKKWPNVHQLPFGAAFCVWIGNNWQVSTSVPLRPLVLFTARACGLKFSSGYLILSLTSFLLFFHLSL